MTDKQHFTEAQIKIKEHIIVRSVVAINEHERLLSTITQIKTMENHFY